MSEKELTSGARQYVTGINIEISGTGSNNTDNRKIDDRRQDRGSYLYNTPNFKGNIKELSTLVVK